MLEQKSSKSENGSKVSIQTQKLIEVTGVKSLDEDDILEAVGAKKDGWLFSKKYKIPVSMIESIENNLRGYLDSKGYYNAKFKVKNFGDKIVISIQENQPVLVRKITIKSDYPIEDLITFSKGEPFDTEKFVEIKKSIKRSLLRDSYCSYDLSTKALVDLDKKVVDLNYTLKKGGECVFGDTEIGVIPWLS